MNKNSNDMGDKIFKILIENKVGHAKAHYIKNELLILFGVSKRLEEMEEAGKEATSLIAHLKDQHGFNEVEEKAQDKIMKVFKYEGHW